jgi:predicted nucleotidyltransferase component of viral defense system
MPAQNNRNNSIRSAVGDFMRRRGLSNEMEQNLIKEVVHHHLLSALSQAGILRHVVFQGGTALRLCYGGERYSEDLDFVCGQGGAYLEQIEFEKLIDSALEVTRDTLGRSFGIDQDAIGLKRPDHSTAIKGNSLAVAAWQIVVPIAMTPKSPKSRVKIEFANVPSYDRGPKVARAAPDLVQIPDVILDVESAGEILADKAVALVARPALKYRDVWDVWDMIDRLKAQADRDIVAKKFSDYGTSDAVAKASHRIAELAKPSTAKLFLDEMSRFLPASRVAEIGNTNLHGEIIARSVMLIRQMAL